jgi:VanZ family protein
MGPEPANRRPGVDLLRSIGRALLRIPFPLSALPVLAWAALIWQQSSFRAVDTGPLVPGVPLLGNLAHAFEYGILALWLVLLLPRRGGWPVLSPVIFALALVLALGYALLDEWHQSGVPDRNASLFDTLTDGIGAASVLVVIGYLGREDASPAGLRLRLLAGLLACLAAAFAATSYQTHHGPGPWPFERAAACLGLEGDRAARIHSPG